MGSTDSNSPLVPFWAQPSHPEVLEVIINTEKEFTSKSISRGNLLAHATFARLDFPPCTKADRPTYATVQMGEDKHLNLNSDLVYINHSCEPSVIFNMHEMKIQAGPDGLKAGQELTFFYPSTEWNMAQGFDCFCGSRNCCGYISGAKNMSSEQLRGKKLNLHIERLLEEQLAAGERESSPTDQAIAILKEAKLNVFRLSEAELISGFDGMLETLRIIKQLDDTIKLTIGIAEESKEKEQLLNEELEQLRAAMNKLRTAGGSKSGAVRQNGVGNRELSGEMGGDTK